MRYPAFHELRTPRLLLRQISPADREDYFLLFSSPETARYMLWEPHTAMEQTDAAIENLMARYETGRCYRWGLELDGSLAGILELLKFDEEENTCSFAYMLRPEFCGRGYGTEALTAALDFAFREMELDAVAADHMGPNLASGAAMRKAGMIFVQTIPGAYRKNNEIFDAHLHRITRQEWENRR